MATEFGRLLSQCGGGEDARVDILEEGTPMVKASGAFEAFHELYDAEGWVRVDFPLPSACLLSFSIPIAMSVRQIVISFTV
jgi:hypothetical protein